MLLQNKIKENLKDLKRKDAEIKRLKKSIKHTNILELKVS